MTQFHVQRPAYLSPTWTFHTCSSLVRYEGFTVALAVEIVGLMMLMRINAIYPSPSHKWIVKLLGTLLLVETIVNCWLITRGERTFSFRHVVNNLKHIPRT